MGRTLTISWSGSSISGVSDGAGRSVSYTYDSHGDLTKFTDAMTNAVNYSYDFPDLGPGRLTQIFYPSFPTTAFVTNVYDAFDRVLTQSDAMNSQNNNTTWNSISPVALGNRRSIRHRPGVLPGCPRHGDDGDERDQRHKRV